LLLTLWNYTPKGIKIIIIVSISAVDRLESYTLLTHSNQITFTRCIYPAFAENVGTANGNSVLLLFDEY